VIHAWLAIFRAVDGVALAELDFAKLVELVDLPSDKGIVVWVGVCRNERATPIYTKSKGLIVFLYSPIASLAWMIWHKYIRKLTIANGGKYINQC